MKTDHATIRRRTALATLGGALAAPLVARAQEAWPTRPVRYINPFPAGGATDTLSRLYCQKMTELTGQQFVVENRGGSGGDVGVDVVAKRQGLGFGERVFNPGHERRTGWADKGYHRAAGAVRWVA